MAVRIDLVLGVGAFRPQLDVAVVDPHCAGLVQRHAMISV